MKKVLVGVTVAAVALLMALPTQAALIKNIKDSSIGSSLATWLINVVMRNGNNSGITNVVTSSGNSGNNTHTSADDQTGSDIVTGTASSSTGVENTANNNLLNEEYESSNGADNEVNDVDDDSNGSATSSDDLDNFMDNDNKSSVSNVNDAKATSGVNVVSSGDSLTSSSTTTGGAAGATFTVNSFNVNVKSVVRRIMSLIP